MSENAAREWHFYVDDMICFAENVIAYTEGMDQEKFVLSGLNYDATLRNLELIGEAATNISDSIRHSYSQIPWRRVLPHEIN
jgi:uncharacterized protein with HEPN domain